MTQDDLEKAITIQESIIRKAQVKARPFNKIIREAKAEQKRLKKIFREAQRAEKQALKASLPPAQRCSHPFCSNRTRTLWCHLHDGRLTCSECLNVVVAGLTVCRVHTPEYMQYKKEYYNPAKRQIWASTTDSFTRMRSLQDLTSFEEWEKMRGKE